MFISVRMLNKNAMLKVPLTPDMIFGMCNIWVVLRRNVLFIVKLSYDVIRPIFEAKKTKEN
jgi:hypothetical protein